MDVGPSGVPFSYTTVVTTKSRIDKGLLAIPASLRSLFPQTSGHVFLISEDGQWVRKTFTGPDSKSKECRIDGMTDFYSRHDVKSGDELVLQVYGEGRYQILPETLYKEKIGALESDLDEAPTEDEADAAIRNLAALTRTKTDDVIGSEFARLANREISRRKVRTRSEVRVREHIPASLRRILTDLYHGCCQVSGFSFLKTDGEPYYEVHHIDPLLGHHVRNVLVVSPNVHAQFTYAAVDQHFDESGWLRRVAFNGEDHSVFQIIDELPDYKKQVHSA